ncbi:MAG TPA: ABC transporter permease, partial [Vicinamibacterales bacterium]|nr:ABC transporter permease [Vicinamibacterales bacterium]
KQKSVAPPFVRFVIKRALAAVLLVFLVSSAALWLAQVAPGDYTSRFDTDPRVLAAERHRLGLDRPAAQQYADWLRRSLTLDMGESFRYHQPVTRLVRVYAANTALLALAALILATALGVPAGLLTGSRRGGVLVRVVRGASLVLLSVPPLITSLLLLLVAARTGWFPVGGLDMPEAGASWTAIVASALHHVALPALALALPLAAMIERLQAEALREALGQPSMLAALARGIPKRRVIGVHAWRLSLGPLLAIYGVIVGSLFSGSFAVEIVTAWPGLGNLMIQALVARDTYLVAGCAAAGTLFLAVAMFLADLAHGAIDPRVETGGAS